MQKWLKFGRFWPKISQNFFLSNHHTQFVEHLPEHVWSKFQLKIMNSVLKKSKIVPKNQMPENRKNVKNNIFFHPKKLYILFSEVNSTQTSLE